MRSLTEVPPQIQRLAPKTISKNELSVVWKKAQRDFANASGLLVNRKLDDLWNRQTASPVISPTKFEIRKLGIDYLDMLRVIVGQLAASLVQSMGRRHFGSQERAWIRKAARKFIEDRKSKHSAHTLFAETFGMFTVKDEANTRIRLSEIVARRGVGRPLMVHVNSELQFGETQYRENLNPSFQTERTQELSPGEKVENPIRYRTLRVREAMELFGTSRSTVYRWIDEGKLKRASMAANLGKRSSCLILTTSAANLLKESSE